MAINKHYSKIRTVPSQAVIYLCVGEQENGVFPLHSSRHVKLLEIFSESGVVVSTSELDLEAVVTRHVTCKSESTRGVGWSY